jgi:outer membrane protein
MCAHDNMLGKTLKFAALWVAGTVAHGQTADLVEPPAAPPAPAIASSPVSPAGQPSAPLMVEPPERRWRLGAALGYGVRSNPLIQSDDIPVIVDLDFGWFGKRWFIDNGDVGFTLFDDDRSTTSLVARLNSDRVFFGKTNTRYVNFTYAGRGVTVAFSPPDPSAPGAIDVQPVEVKPPDRDYAIEVGVETLIDGEWGSTTLRAFHDVSGTHEGYELSADFSRRWTAGRFSIAPMVGVAYKSARLNDYYWGVNASESNVALPQYSAGAGFAFQGGALANYYISRNLRLAVSLNYERLPDSVARSPLAEDDYVLAYFSGLAWTF